MYIATNNILKLKPVYALLLNIYALQRKIKMVKRDGGSTYLAKFGLHIWHFPLQLQRKEILSANFLHYVY